MAIHKHSRHILISIGSNEAGAWGDPLQTLSTVLKTLTKNKIHVKVASRIFTSSPIGGGRQAQFFNAALLVETSLPLATLLRLFKRLEREAGRRLGRRWGPRPLDIDIIAAPVQLRPPHRGRRRAGQLIVPHPESHLRAFVLVPLLDVAPFWVHPLRRRGVQALLEQARVRRQRRGVKPLATGPDGSPAGFPSQPLVRGVRTAGRQQDA